MKQLAKIILNGNYEENQYPITRFMFNLNHKPYTMKLEHHGGDAITYNPLKT